MTKSELTFDQLVALRVFWWKEIGALTLGKFRVNLVSFGTAAIYWCLFFIPTLFMPDERPSQRIWGVILLCTGTVTVPVVMLLTAKRITEKPFTLWLAGLDRMEAERIVARHVASNPMRR